MLFSTVIVIPPPPQVDAAFEVEPHPDPVVRELVREVEQLRRDNATLRLQLEELGKGLGYNGPRPR